MEENRVAVVVRGNEVQSTRDDCHLNLDSGEDLAFF